jgi:uncharacterized membrane protein YgcG
MQALSGRFHLVFAVLVLGLGLGGVALAQSSGGSSSANVTLLDGKLRISPATFAPGKLTIMVVNAGKLSHGLAIMGTHLQPRRTPTIPSGKTAKLTVTLSAGMYHVWDPVRSSMTHATMLMVKAAKSGTAGSTAGNGSVAGSGGSSGGSSGGGTITGGGGGTMPGMDPNDPCAGM